MSTSPAPTQAFALRAFRRLGLGLLCATAIGLAGCGGGDGDASSTSGGTGSSGCTDVARTLTYNGTAVAGFTNGQKVCFDTASSTTLSFNGTTLTSPVQNTAVSAPYSAWKFTYGSVVMELVLNAGALYEINVADASRFYGQFAK